MEEEKITQEIQEFIENTTQEIDVNEYEQEIFDEEIEETEEEDGI